jgi:alkanesulfonate monooxygenase SsuD/methylene tetrahydromethanopterin reductase-like flavin-dependent oxidoreductase (luciferase family)
MKVGIGIPNTMLGATGDQLLEWARRAEARGFSTLATIGRVVYPGYGDLVALAAAAGATERIGLMTNILLAPAFDPVQLAKDTASLDQLSGGRFTLGIGVGARPDDFAAVGRGFHDRGRRTDELLELLHRAWAGEDVAGSGFAVGPTPVRGRVPLAIGGRPEIAARRAVRWSAAWTVGGGGPHMAAQGIEVFRRTWTELGGEGEPRIVALNYFSLGEEVREESERNLRTYYGHLRDWVDAIATNQPRDEAAVRETLTAFEDLGIDELIFDPTVADPEQVDRLADAVL